MICEKTSKRPSGDSTLASEDVYIRRLGEGNLLHQFNGVKVEGHIRSLQDLISA